MVGKGLVLSLARAGGVLACCRLATRRAARILTYHGVDALQDPLLNVDRLQVEPALFRAHMECLARRCTVIPLREMIDALAGGRPLPPLAAAVTFDDGYRNNLEVAAPILLKLGLPATFFITTGFMDSRARPWWYELRAALARTQAAQVRHPLDPGRVHPLGTPDERRTAILALEPALVPLSSEARSEALRQILAQCGAVDRTLPYPLMNWQEAARLAAHGFDVGSHTVTHLSLAHEPPELGAREVVDAGAELSRRTGREAAICAYPYGLLPRDPSDLIQRLRAAGLRAGLTTTFGLNRAGADLFALRRLDVTGGRDLLNFDALISGFTSRAASPKNRLFARA